MSENGHTKQSFDVVRLNSVPDERFLQTLLVLLSLTKYKNQYRMHSKTTTKQWPLHFHNIKKQYFAWILGIDSSKINFTDHAPQTIIPHPSQHKLSRRIATRPAEREDVNGKQIPNPR